MNADQFDPHTCSAEEAVAHARALLEQVESEWQDVQEIARQLRESRPPGWPV